ncbi:MAG: hypothetical protein ACK5LY_03970 [Lachnospirales bacterium]
MKKITALFLVLILTTLSSCTKDDIVTSTDEIEIPTESNKITSETKDEAEVEVDVLEDIPKVNNGFDVMMSATNVIEETMYGDIYDYVQEHENTYTPVDGYLLSYSEEFVNSLTSYEEVFKSEDEYTELAELGLALYPDIVEMLEAYNELVTYEDQKEYENDGGEKGQELTSKVYVLFNVLRYPFEDYNAAYEELYVKYNEDNVAKYEEEGLIFSLNISSFLDDVLELHNYLYNNGFTNEDLENVNFDNVSSMKEKTINHYNLTMENLSLAEEEGFSEEFLLYGNDAINILYSDVMAIYDRIETDTFSAEGDWEKMISDYNTLVGYCNN